MKGHFRTLIALMILLFTQLMQPDFFLSHVLAASPDPSPTIHLIGTEQVIVVDGDLIEPGWQHSVWVRDFVECMPGDMLRPDVETEVAVTYDDKYLYVGFISHDDPSRIRATRCERDMLEDNQDMVQVFIDTYGNSEWGYVLCVNPYGVQMDALYSVRGEVDRNQSELDVSYDLVWKSAAVITEDGYQVEIAIPFASLRFPSVTDHSWRMDFARHCYRESHYKYVWAAYNRSEPCQICQWRRVTGLVHRSQSASFELIPSLLGTQSGNIEGNGTDESPYRLYNDDPSAEASVLARYIPSSNVTIETAVNPDFSQIEADADQIDVNSHTALFYPEQRPFFQEGADLFQTPFQIFYSRSINDPELAARLTARLSRSSVAVISARDEHSPFILPFEEGSACLLGGKSFSNIIRLKQTVGAHSHIGGLATDRRYDDGGSGTIISADGKVQLSPNIQFDWQLVGSRTEEPTDTVLRQQLDELIDAERIPRLIDNDSYTSTFDGESYWGHAIHTALNQSWRHARIDLAYDEASPAYRPDLGYQTYNNVREVSLWASYTFEFERGLLQEIMPWIYTGNIWNHDRGEQKDRYIFVTLRTKLRAAQTKLITQIARSAETYHGTYYGNILGFNGQLTMTPVGFLQFRFDVNFHRCIARLHYVADKRQYYSTNMTFRPTDRTSLELSYQYRQARVQDTDQMLYKGFLARAKLNHQFTGRMALRLVVQRNDFSGTWDLQPLLTYQINPFSELYLGSSYGYDELTCPEVDGETQQTRLASRQFYVKLKHLFEL